MPTCPRCNKRPTDRTGSGKALDYCEICQRHRTIEKQQAFKYACVEYTGNVCTFCGEAIECQACLCYRAPKGEPAGRRVSSMTGRTPLTESVKDVLDHKVVCCSNCERAHYRCRSTTPSKKKQKIVDYLGGQCVSCGESRPTVLDAHHTAGKGHESKKFSPGDRVSRSWEEVRNELDKCELLCSNCHARLHFVEAREQREREA